MTILIGKKHQELLAWLENEWIRNGSPVCCIDGFSGAGKTNISRELLKRLKSSKKLKKISVDVPEESIDIVTDVLLDIATALDNQAIPDMAEAIDKGEDLLQAFKRVLMLHKVLIIIDEFQRIFSTTQNCPPKNLARALQELANNSAINGRLLLLSNKSLEQARWSEHFDYKTLPNLPINEAEQLLTFLLKEKGKENEIAVEDRRDVVQWLGGNPRAMRVLVSALRYDSLKDLIGSQTDTWELRNRKVSPDLLHKLEKDFLERILKNISEDALGFLYRLAVYRKSFKLEAMEYSATNNTNMNRLRNELMDAFLIEREQEDDKNRYLLHPLVRETALHLYKNATLKEFKIAHSLAANYYTRHFEAKQITQSGKLASYFVEARYHLVYAEKEDELKKITIFFEKHLLATFNWKSPIPDDEYKLNDQIALLSALLEYGGVKKLEDYLIRCLRARNKEGDLEQALVYIHRSLSSENQVNWLLCIKLECEAYGIETAIKTAKKAIDQVKINKDSVKLYLDCSELLVKGNNIEEAISFLKKGIDKIPIELYVYRLYQNCAELLVKDNQPNEAILLLQQGIAKIPAEFNICQLHQFCAKLLDQDNQHENAVMLLQQGIEKLPAATNLYLAYAELLVQDDKIKDAIYLLKQGVEKIHADKNIHQLYLYCGKLLVRNNQLKEAIELLQQGIVKIPIDKEVRTLYQACADLLVHDNRIKEAIELLQQGIANIPADKEVRTLYQACADLLARDNGVKEAIELLQQGIAKIPTDKAVADLYQACADLLARDNRVKEAIELLQQGIAKIPADKAVSTLYQACGELLVRGNRIKEAIELLQQGIANIPADKAVSTLYQACGELLVRDNRIKEAIELLQQGIAKIPADKAVADLYQACADLLARDDRVKEAIELLQQGIANIPADKAVSTLYQACADLLVRDNRVKESIELLQQGIANIPADKAVSDLYLACAELLKNDNQTKESIELLQQGITNIPADKGLSFLYLACADLFVRDNNRIKEAIELLQQGIIKIPAVNRSKSFLHILIYYAFATKNRLVLEQLINNKAIETWQQNLVQAFLYQYDDDWNNALLTIQQAQQKNSTKVSFIEQEAFILLCLGKIEPAQQVLKQWNENNLNKAIYWLQAWLALRSGNHQQALDSANHYLDAPLENRGIDEQFLLQLWDENKAKGENPLPLHFPILPPALTGLPENVSRLPNDPPIFNVPENKDMLEINDTKDELVLLHLSDLHINNQDEATRYISQLKSDLLNEIKIKRLDYLVLSGDIGNYATTGEYQAAAFFVESLIKQFSISREKIIITAGNHDVSYELSKQEGYQFEHSLPKNLKEDEYYKTGDDGYLVRTKDGYQQRFKNFNEAFYQPITQENYPLDYKEQAILHIDQENKLLFLALNSAWEIDHKFQKRASIHSVALAKALNAILEGDYQDWLKIAVWHHPVTGDEKMNDEFLQQLVVNGFKICMHGHIHKAKKDIFNYDDTERDLRIVGAGTFGAYTSELVPCIPWQYNLLTWNKKEAYITVLSRKREELNGAWKADRRWGNNNSSDSYKIELSKKEN